MYFEDLLALIGREPVFETGLLLAGDVNPNYLRRQLSEWVAQGKLLRLRRGLYAPAPPYQKSKPHPFLLANRLVPASYVSASSALAYYSMIPEYVPAVTSVTTGRPGVWKNPSGEFIYRHVQSSLFYGYERQQLTREQHAFIAKPEKALLDMVYLQPGGDDPAYLASLRLQRIDKLDIHRLNQLAARTGKPKLLRAAENIAELISGETEGIPLP
jgi:predicted transcriptional regulator of viral defense system